MDNKTYTRNAHSVCCLTYYAVFVIKYRRKVITPEILAFMRSHTDYLISQRYHGKLLEFNGEEDHIHMITSYQEHCKYKAFRSLQTRKNNI